jgi:hypothetical protein
MHCRCGGDGGGGDGGGGRGDDGGGDDDAGDDNDGDSTRLCGACSGRLGDATGHPCMMVRANEQHTVIHLMLPRCGEGGSRSGGGGIAVGLDGNVGIAVRSSHSPIAESPGRRPTPPCHPLSKTTHPRWPLLQNTVPPAHKQRRAALPVPNRVKFAFLTRPNSKAARIAILAADALHPMCASNVPTKPGELLSPDEAARRVPLDISKDMPDGHFARKNPVEKAQPGRHHDGDDHQCPLSPQCDASAPAFTRATCARPRARYSYRVYRSRSDEYKKGE